jgi:hypothetical protein
MQELNQLRGVASNDLSHIAWGNSKNGKTVGSVFTADYLGNKTTVHMITKDFEGIRAITMEDHAIYVITDTSSIEKLKITHGITN